MYTVNCNIGQITIRAEVDLMPTFIHWLNKLFSWSNSMAVPYRLHFVFCTVRWIFFSRWFCPFFTKSVSNYAISKTYKLVIDRPMAKGEWWIANSLWEFNSRSIDILCKCTNLLYMNIFNKEAKESENVCMQYAMCNASCRRNDEKPKLKHESYQGKLGKPMHWISFVNVKDSKCIIHCCIGFRCGK